MDGPRDDRAARRSRPRVRRPRPTTRRDQRADRRVRARGRRRRSRSTRTTSRSGSGGTGSIRRSTRCSCSTATSSSPGPRSTGDAARPTSGRRIGAAASAPRCSRGSRRGRASSATAEVGQTKTDANAAARELFLVERLRADVDLVDHPDRRWTSRRRPPEPPTGIEIRPYQPADARDVAPRHRCRVHRVARARPRAVRGVGVATILAHPRSAPELSPLAFDGDELVGVVLAYDYPELGEGWIHAARDQGHATGGEGSPQAMLRTVVRLVLRTRPADRRRLDRLADRGARRCTRRSACAWSASTRATRSALTAERRPRDSNPRGGCPPTRSPGVPLRPLGQASAVESSGGTTPNGRPFRGGRRVRGGDRIRTCEGRVRPLTAFEAVPFVRSGTPPGRV